MKAAASFGGLVQKPGKKKSSIFLLMNSRNREGITIVKVVAPSMQPVMLYRKRGGALIT